VSSRRKNEKPAKVYRGKSGDETAFPVVRRILVENFRRYRKSYALAIFCMIIVAATTAYSAYIIKDVVNEVFDNRSLGAAYGIAGLILLIFFTKGIAGFGQEVILSRIGNNIVARYQELAYNQMLHLGVGFYSDTRSAYLVGQINQNISGVKNMLNTLITMFARDLLTLVGLIFVMVYQDPLMSVGALVVLPVAGYVLSRYVKKIKSLSKKSVHVNSQVASAMVETAQGIPVVKAFTMEDQLEKKVGKLIKTGEKQSNGIALVNARTRPLTETLGGLAIAGAVAFGGWRVIALDGNPGALLSFLTAAMLAYDPARRLAAFRVQFEKSLVNARMLYDLIDTPPRQADKPDAVAAQVSKGEIVFDKVNFAYVAGEPVLYNLSLTVEAGKTTALVGPSGGGKSTIIALILRFYDLHSGKILVDGQNISDVKIADLRRKIAYVSQSPVLFEGTIRENIRYGRPDATDEEMFEAAKSAKAHGFIMQMPLGYDTPVGELGSNLSGGQRQRLSIARAILRNAPILLLDEATSALDNESEKHVQQALDKLMKGKTTLVVAHRLSTIKNADKIVVIDQGKVAEQGDHERLMSSESGIYSKLYNINQGKGRKKSTKEDDKGTSTSARTKSRKTA
jgi:ATP-binding cassette, subfamily B, bacterial MsbA